MNQDLVLKTSSSEYYSMCINKITIIIKDDQQKTMHYRTVETVPKPNRKIIERSNIDTLNTQIHDHSLSWLGTDTSIQSGGVRIIVIETVIDG